MSTNVATRKRAAVSAAQRSAPPLASAPAASKGGARKTPPGTNAIYHRIAEAIAAHKLAPGAKLGEEALGDIFGVSRTKIRQALFQLASGKLVTLIAGRGAFVAQPTVKEAREVFEARRMVESAVLAAFIERASAKDMAALKAHIGEQHRASGNGSAHTRNHLLGDFHTVIARLAGNVVLTEIVGDLVARTSLITLLYQNTRGAVESLNEHLGLMAAIEKRDTKQAVKLMLEHLNDVESGLVLKEETPITADLKSALA